jgi:hypothetical protein
MDEKQMAVNYAGARLGIGILMVVFPGLVFRGIAGESTPVIRLIGRLVGIRDAILGAGALAALQNDEPAGRWAAYGAAADAGDALAVLLAYRHLPNRKRFGLLSLAVSGAATGAHIYSRAGSTT